MKTIGKIKCFSGIHQDISILENEINQWLAHDPDIEIAQLTQSEFGSKTGRDIVLTILYKAPFDA